MAVAPREGNFIHELKQLLRANEHYVYYNAAKANEQQQQKQQ